MSEPANGGNGRISVSEDRLRALLSEFKLELVRELDQYATKATVETLDARVKVLELWQATVISAGKVRSRISDRALAWAALSAALLGSVATLIWLNAR